MPALPRAVCLHVGHNKTGSTFLQSALALSGPALAAQGITYPIDPDKAEIARQGLFNGGNLRGQPGALAELIASGAARAGERLLISSESFFFHLMRDGPGFVAEYRAACPGMPLHVLLYIRDPLDHAVSQYHQRVKRGGYTGSLGESLSSYAIPARAAEVITLLCEAGADVQVLNYSRHRDSLLDTFAQWLDLPAGALTAPKAMQVNRSLSQAELVLQRAFNRHFGESARRLVSDVLCDALPDIRSDTPPLAPDDLKRFLDAMREMTETERFRAAVPASERPHVGTLEDHIARFPPPTDNPVLTVTAAQLNLLADAMARHLKKDDLRRKPEGGAARKSKRRGGRQANSRL